MPQAACSLRQLPQTSINVRGEIFSRSSGTTLAAPSRVPGRVPSTIALSIARGGGHGADMAARSLGFLVGAGGATMYSPIIYKVIEAKSANGLSLSTVCAQLLGYSCAVAYSYNRGFPVSTYVETIFLTIQSAILMTLALWFDKTPNILAAAIGGVFYVALAAYVFFKGPPIALLAVLQGSATVLLTGALVPQILRNWRQKNSGQWSLFTAGLSVAGNAIRVFTTLQLTRDPLLLSGFVFGLTLNSILFAQIILYGRSM